MQYFAKYQPEAGFKFSLDGIHNVPKPAAYAGLYCLNPPGALYQIDPNPLQVHLNSNLDWEGFFNIQISKINLHFLILKPTYKPEIFGRFCDIQRCKVSSKHLHDN